MQIETEKISSNTEIEANVISKIFVKSVETVVDNLRLISSAPSVQNSDNSGIDLLGLADHNTNNLTDFYVWLDSKGKIIGSSSAIDGANKQLAKYLSNTTFFSFPETAFSHYVSNITYFENIPRIFISFPILDSNMKDQINVSAATSGNDHSLTNISSNVAGKFKGVIAASIRIDKLGEYLQSQIPSEYNGFVGVVNSRGIILSSANQSQIGKNIFVTDLNPIIPARSKDTFNLYLNQSFIEKKPRLQNITFDKKHISIGYQNLIFGQPIGDQFATLFVVSSHLTPDKIGSLMQHQAFFSFTVYAIILLLATGMVLIILFWNKKLKEIVDKKTKELQKANQNLQIANEQLKVNDKMQKDFINIAAHELRTPLQTIMGNTEMAISDPLYRKFDYNNGQFLDAISRNTLRIYKLTEYLLDVTRIESGLLNIKKEQFNINEKVKRVVDNFRNNQEAAGCNDNYLYRKKKNVELTFVTPKVNPITVEADEVRIEQVISNLVDNAIKFIDKEPGKVTISVDVMDGDENPHNNVKDKKKLIVSVKDNGRGIHPDILPNLFHKFTSKAEFGTGLGLFIAKSVIESHGGKVWADNNKDGKGATFSFSLPLKG